MADTYIDTRKRNSLLTLLGSKKEGRKLSMVTCYDAAFARLVERSSVDMVLVGDSLGNVMMGYDSTLPVTIDDMLIYSASVARVLKDTFLAVDMPFGSYQVSPEQAVENAVRLVQEGGAQAVKLEGGVEIVPQVRKVIAAGIPVVGHLGLTPQSVHALGGYRVQGRDAAKRQKILDDAKALADAGISLLVLELVPADLAAEITQSIDIPTIGIGAGSDVDGQVLVLQDMLGFANDFKPKFLKTYANLEQTVLGALDAYNTDVKEGVFPAPEHSYKS